MKTTELKARRLLLEDRVTSPAPGVFLVYDGNVYQVNNYRCDCPSRTLRCAHALAALMYETRHPVTLFG
jgi:hypothetical protein